MILDFNVVKHQNHRENLKKKKISDPRSDERTGESKKTEKWLGEFCTKSSRRSGELIQLDFYRNSFYLHLHLKRNYKIKPYSGFWAIHLSWCWIYLGTSFISWKSLFKKKKKTFIGRLTTVASPYGQECRKSGSEGEDEKKAETSVKEKFEDLRISS